MHREGKKVLHYSTAEQFLSIIHSTNSINEYDDDELAEIKLKIKNPVFFLLDTNSFNLLKKFIDTLPSNFNFLIDNNFGSIMDKQKFMKCNTANMLFSSLEAKSLH